MYYYVIKGKRKEKVLTETTDSEGVVTLTSSVTEVDDKEVVPWETAVEYIKDGYKVYMVNDNGEEEEVGPLIEEDMGEEVVNPEPPYSSATETEIGDTPLISTTEETVTVPQSASATNRLEYSFTPTRNGYTLLGIVGYRIIGSSNLFPYRLAFEGGTVNIGLRNISSTSVTSANVMLNLLWLKNKAVQQGEQSNG